MPLFKLGTTVDQNGEVKNVYLMQGNAVRDAEVKEINNKQTSKVSIAAAKKSDGSTVFVTLQGWRNRAMEVSRIAKMDSVLAIGVLKSHEYNERTYWELDAEFVSISGASRGSGASRAAASTANNFTDDFVPFDEEEDGGELPF